MRRNCYSRLEGVRCDSSGETSRTHVREERAKERSEAEVEDLSQRESVADAALQNQRSPRFEVNEDRAPSEDRREVITSAVDVDIQRSAGSMYHGETSLARK